MRKVNAVIERASDGRYSIYMDADDLDYMVTGTGDSAKEAIKVFNGGYDDIKRVYADEGREFEEVEFSFVYDTASFLSCFQKSFTLAGLEHITGIAQGQLSHYANGRRKPSRQTVEKMQDALHSFGEELAHISFI